MSYNTFGHMFRVTTFGESHGAAIGCVVDGCPPRIPLSAADIQRDLDRRRPGQSRFTTQRQEPDAVKILSGLFIDEASGQEVTTGTPIALVIIGDDHDLAARERLDRELDAADAFAHQVHFARGGNGQATGSPICPRWRR